MKDYIITYPRAPWWFPPDNGDWFDNTVSGSVTLATSPLPLFSFTLNDIERGVIRWFGQAISPPNNDTLITWQILVNGAPDRVYGSIVGLISSIVMPTETLIRLPKRSTVVLQVSTTNVAAITCTGRLKGWSWVTE